MVDGSLVTSSLVVAGEMELENSRHSAPLQIAAPLAATIATADCRVRPGRAGPGPPGPTALLHHSGLRAPGRAPTDPG